MLDRPGPIALETVESADWEVPLSGLLNLEHPEGEGGGARRPPEPITVRFHAIEHPQRGTFIVDTGVERAVHDPERAAVRGMVASFMKIEEKLVVRTDLASFLAKSGPLAGVFLTHLHLDHVMGLPDVPRHTAIYAGPGETTPRSVQNVVMRSNIARLLDGHDAIGRVEVRSRSRGPLRRRGRRVRRRLGVGDLGPGHTPGSTAYLVRTGQGPVLLTGDASHTRWGWTTTSSRAPIPMIPLGVPRASASCARSRRTIPVSEVRLGHRR